MDPRRKEHWKTYADRRDAALAKTPGGGQGTDGSNPSGGKPAGGKDSGKDGGKEGGKGGKKGGGKKDGGKGGGKPGGKTARAVYDTYGKRRPLREGEVRAALVIWRKGWG